MYQWHNKQVRWIKNFEKLNYTHLTLSVRVDQVYLLICYEISIYANVYVAKCLNFVRIIMMNLIWLTGISSEN